MYSILRVQGERAKLEAIRQRVAEADSNAGAAITRRGELAIDLSKHAQWDEHQWQVENRLSTLSEILEEIRRMGLSSVVDLGIDLSLQRRKDVAITVRRFRLRSSLMDRLASDDLDFELTLYIDLVV